MSQPEDNNNDVGLSEALNVSSDMPPLPPRPLKPLITLTKTDSSASLDQTMNPLLEPSNSGLENTDNELNKDKIAVTNTMPERIKSQERQLHQRRRSDADISTDNQAILPQIRQLRHKRSQSSEVGSISQEQRQGTNLTRHGTDDEHGHSRRGSIAAAFRRRFGSLSAVNLTRSHNNSRSNNNSHDGIPTQSFPDVNMQPSVGYRGNIVTNMPDDWPSTDWPSASQAASPLSATFSRDSEDVRNWPHNTNGNSQNRRSLALDTFESPTPNTGPGKSYMDKWAALSSPYGGKLDYETALDLDLALSHYANSMRSRYALSMIGFAGLVWLGLYYGITIWILAAALACWVYILRRFDASDATIWSHLVEIERGNRLLGRRAESVEWVNHIVGKLWPLINRELFTPAIDLMEDVLKEQCPSIVYAVRVEDVDQGVHPFRVRGIRVLSPQKDLQPNDDIEAFGDGIHLEADFIYQAAPAATRQQESRNAHMICSLTMGVKGFAGVTVPAFAELLTCIGTCRFKLQPSPDPPFVKLGNFTLMRRPRIDISVKPLRTVNIMNLPLISDYILHCINIVVDRFVWPKSYTLDVSKLILGDDVPHNSTTIGVICVTFHSAKSLRNADVLGKSDAYATISLHQSGKTRFRTRILNNELNPVWEETGFMLVTRDDLRNQEKIRLQVWDADRWNSDDGLGGIDLPLAPLVAKPGIITKHTSPLMDLSRNAESKGELTYSIGYYPKTTKNKRTSAGILSILVHEGTDLELRTAPREVSPEDVSIFGTPSSVRLGLNNSNQSNNGVFPSSYVELIVNDELTYRSRVKPTNPRPYWNCLTDRVIRDWHTCRIRVVIRDLRSRERDPVLGIIAFELKDIINQIPEGQNMEMTRWFRLMGGVGYGKIRISIVFHPIEITIPKHISGYNVGTLHVSDICATDLSGLAEGMPVYCRLSLSSDDNSETFDTETAKLTTKDVSPLPVPATTVESLASTLLTEASWPNIEATLPVNARYTTALIIQLRQRKLRREVVAFGVVWLKDLIDDEMVSADIPIFIPGDIRPFERDITPQSNIINLRTAAHDMIKTATGPDKVRLERFVGHIRFNIVFRGGIADKHRKGKHTNTFLQRAMEVHDIIQDENIVNTDSVDPSYEDLRKSLEISGTSEEYLDSVVKLRHPQRASLENETSTMEGESGNNSNRSSISGYSQYSQKSKTFAKMATTNSEDRNECRTNEHYKDETPERTSLSDDSVHRRRVRDEQGAMKYKGVRTLKWAKDKLDEGSHKVKHLLRPRHREHSSQLDTEG
ncbi:hypothetical protein BDF19DRAFT_456109 [Syncephalis fuscata]|nr:hypothetical protein BDF19DRAFT_456109 [Syncephalis fuscata]